MLYIGYLIFHILQNWKSFIKSHLSNIKDTVPFVKLILTSNSANFFLDLPLTLKSGAPSPSAPLWVLAFLFFPLKAWDHQGLSSWAWERVSIRMCVHEHTTHPQKILSQSWAWVSWMIKENLGEGRMVQWPPPGKLPNWELSLYTNPNLSTAMVSTSSSFCAFATQDMSPHNSFYGSTQAFGLRLIFTTAQLWGRD